METEHMEKKTKHRLLGILVVVALVLILLPFIKTKETSDEVTIHPALTEQKTTSAIEVKEDILTPQITENPSVTPNIQSDDAVANIPITPEKQKIEEPKKQERQQKKLLNSRRIFVEGIKQSIPNDGLFKIKNSVWVLETKPFNEKLKALSFVNELRRHHYPAFYQTIKSTHRKKYVVFVGPTQQFHSGIQLQGQLKKERGVKSMLIKVH